MKWEKTHGFFFLCPLPMAAGVFFFDESFDGSAS